MPQKTRRERDRDERCEQILQAAAAITSEAGLESLSIRKIAQRTEYSPAVIYHYFENKDDIIEQLLSRGYQNILRALGAAKSPSGDPKQNIAEATRGYIAMALQNHNYYKAFVLSDSPRILEHTAVLFRGAASERPSLAMMCEELKKLAPKRDDEWIELTTQVMWTALFGLSVRLLVEHDLPEEQQKRLIDHHVEFMLSSISSLAGE